MKEGRIAIPSDGEGGLEGIRSGHFGHCDIFTIVDVKEGKVTNVSKIQNSGHAAGGCMAPVTLLAGHNVNALVVKGIGPRPLEGFRQAGIRVYHESFNSDIRAVVEHLIDGRLSEIGDEQTCGGHGGGCQHHS